MFNRLGFTLIELLVVVTIIVVLLAMLTPALDKAIYAAELAACGAQLDGVASGAINYGMNYKRRYPYRAAMDDRNTGNYFTRNITLPFGIHNKTYLQGYDDRPAMRPFIQIKALQCPPAGELDLNGDPSPPDGEMIFSSYSLWLGWEYKDPGASVSVNPTYSWAGRGMLKIGDKWGYRFDANNDHVPDGMRNYGVLAGDWLARLNAFGIGHESAHPDRGGNLKEFRRQNEKWSKDNPSEIMATISDWRDGSGDSFEVNYAYDDGSVRRLDKVDGRLGENGKFEPRLDLVAGAHTENWGHYNGGLAVPK